MSLFKADMIPEKMSDVKKLFLGLKLRDSFTMVWTNIRVNSLSGMAGKLGEMDYYLGDQGIKLFLQLI